ncbi:hypothetical protein MRS76_20500 [Rhizobiaceae bacterium n13]|uniref:hypothetical protein n=1 Tax=Ferirhizobium litorale TaxID=2927786 RepID=UPI0024B31D83|nr:hypothetical protein [Fererhizobium litorale]MDI7864323.1 hypothetical protein [Fererhizobium litorale]
MESVAISLHESSGLDIVATIERARTLLDAGDCQAARLLASGAYEQAKAVGGYAEKVKASRQLIDKARRMQADALKIEAYATIRLADEVDAAQKSGVLVSRGRPKNSGRELVLTLSDIGFGRRDLFSARRLRAAERVKPGFIESVIESRMAGGLEPNRKSLASALKTSDRPVYRDLEVSATHRLADGRQVSTLKWYEIDGAIRRAQRDLDILSKVKAHCVPASDDQLIVDVIGSQRLRQMCGGGDE